MRRRFVALLMVVTLLLTMVPAALAEGAGGTTYTVQSQEEFAAAIESIRAQEEPEAVIVLTGDISTGSTPITVEGKKITITSDNEGVYQLSNGTFALVGDLVLDKIKMSGSDDKNIFACGHTFETTENFEGFVYTNSSGNRVDCINALYGGDYQADVAEGGTNLILRGKGVYEWAFGGGLDSAVYGDTNILIDSPDVNVGNLIGGGWGQEKNSGQIYGDTHVTVRQGTARSIVGGGKGNGTDKESARVHGDTWVVTGGGEAPAYIGTATESYAGSENSTVNNTHFIAKAGTDATYSGGMKVIGGGLNDIVLGTTYVEVTGDAKINTICGGAAGNHDEDISHTVIQNENNEPYAVHIVYNSTANCEYGIGIYAGAPNAGQSTIHGDVLVEVKQGQLQYVNLDDAYTDGDERSPGAQIYGDATLRVSNGDIAQIVGCAAHEQPDSPYHSYVIYDGCGTETVPQKSGYLYKFENVTLKNQANVKIDSDEFTDFDAVQRPFYSIQNLEIIENSALNTRASNTMVLNDVTMDQGSWTAQGMTWVYEALNSRNSKLLFEDYTAVGYNHRKDEDPSLVTNFTSSGDRIVFLESGYVNKVYGNMELNNSDLTLLSPLNVWGNWQGGDSLLRLPVTTDNNYTGQKGSPSIPLNIDGTSAGMCEVRTVKPDNADMGETAQMPAVGDNYVTDWQAEGQTSAKFSLENQDAVAKGLYLKKVTDPADGSYDMWQVAQRDPDEKITIQYQWAGASPSDVELPETVTMYPGPFVAAEEPVTAEKDFSFDGWFTDKDCTVKFADGSEVSANMVLYGQWKKSDPPTPPTPDKDVLWYYEVYYEGTNKFVRYEYGQGGHVKPDNKVEISHTQFDGKDLGWGEVLGEHYIFDAENPNNRLSAFAKDADRDHPLRIYYKLMPHTLTYTYDGTEPDGLVPPDAVSTKYSAKVEMAAPTVPGYTFKGWTVKESADETVEIGGNTLTMPNADVVLVGRWEKDINVTPLQFYYLFKDGDHGSLAAPFGFTLDRNETMTAKGFDVPAVTAAEGYIFTGWRDEKGTDMTQEDILKLPALCCKTFTAQYRADESPVPPTPPTPGPGPGPVPPENPSIPWTPLEPAQEIIPLTPLEPAQEITPLVPLEPAENIVTPEQPTDPGEYHGPKTGDDHLMLYALAGMALCAAGAGAVLLRKRKEH